jgi:dihydropteroate synthase
MRAVLDLGADIINDVWALRQPGAREAVAAHPSCGVCLMHMHRDPQTMQTAPMQGDVLPKVLAFWAEQVAQLRLLNVDPSRISLDPGIGFGKTVAQNFALLARQCELLKAGYPLLLGWSRKSSIGTVSGIPAAAERLVPSVTAAMLAVDRGAAIVRVHDVRDTVAALAVWQAMKAEEPQSLAPASTNQQKRQTS